MTNEEQLVMFLKTTAMAVSHDEQPVFTAIATTLALAYYEPELIGALARTFMANQSPEQQAAFLTGTRTIADLMQFEVAS